MILNVNKKIAAQIALSKKLYINGWMLKDDLKKSHECKEQL